MLGNNDELARALIALRGIGDRLERRGSLLAIGLILGCADALAWLGRRLFRRNLLPAPETRGLLRLAGGLNKMAILLLHRHLRRQSRPRA